jgi:hypothetical protein
MLELLDISVVIVLEDGDPDGYDSGGVGDEN